MTLYFVTFEVTTKIGQRERRTYVKSVSEEFDSEKSAADTIKSWAEEAEKENLDASITGISKL